MTKISVVGPISFDNIIKTHKEFRAVLSPICEGKNKASFSVEELAIENGGSGLNVVYNLALLGEKTRLYSCVGDDFSFSNFIKKSVDLKNVIKSKKLTSRRFINSDVDNIELNSYFDGATKDGVNLDISFSSSTKFVLVSNFEINAMIKALKQAKKMGIKTIFSPSSQIKSMMIDELNSCLENTDILIVNKQEFEQIKQKSQKTDEQMLESFENIVITYGINGSKIFDNMYNMEEIEGVENPNFIDKVGVGSAYKAGFLKGLSEGYSILKSARLGAVLASVSTQKSGAQNHQISWESLKSLYKDTFNEKL